MPQHLSRSLLATLATWLAAASCVGDIAPNGAGRRSVPRDPTTGPQPPGLAPPSHPPPTPDLTDGPPDAELLAAARAGRLEAPDVEVHARRLLARPEAAVGLARFAGELYGTRDVREANKDLMVYPDWNGEKDFDLGPIYDPVAAYKDRLTIALRFYIPHTRDLHGSRTSTTTRVASPSPKTSPAPPGGISIDRYIARKIGAGDAFSSTAVGRGDSLSSDGSNQSFPLIHYPEAAFAKLFGGGLPGGGGGFVGDFVSKDRSILDWLRADAVRLNGRLAGPERAKLDQYLESLRSLERQLQTRGMAQGACQGLSAPTSKTPESCSGQTGTNGCGQGIEQLVDLSFLAHQCGLTHVSHVSFEGMGGPHIKYDWLGDPRNHHDDNHANDTAILQKIETWWFSMIGRLAGALAKAPAGSGTMLDESLIILVNTGGGLHHRGFDRHPLIMLGGRAGSAGRYLEYPEGKHFKGEAFAAIASAFGVPTEKFGDPKYCPGPLAGLI